jgi:hypothetical protein
MNQNDLLINIGLEFQRLKQALPHYSNSNFESGIGLIMHVNSIYEKMIALYLAAKGHALNKSLLICTDENGIPFQRPVLPEEYIRMNRNVLPHECLEQILILRKCRNEVAHYNKKLSEGELISFAQAFDELVLWFVARCQKECSDNLDHSNVAQLKNSIFSLTEQIKRTIEKTRNATCANSDDQIEQLRRELLGEIQEIKHAILDLNRKISVLAERISDCQDRAD